MKTTIISLVLSYIRLGWRVLPIPHGQKAPVLEKWPELRITEQDAPKYFRNKMNVGLLLGSPSNGLVDVDLDVREAAMLAPQFLPPTDRIHGRAGNPHSHWWYIIPTAPGPAKYEDIDGTSLVEIRSDGQQTIVPPSLHPSGESLVWEGEGEPGKVTAKDLQTAVRRLSACTLLARHWPKRGSRQKAALALAGALMRADWSASDAAKFISYAAKAANDEEWGDRGDTVASTEKRLAAERDATGWPTLSELLGQKIVSRIRDWLGAKATASQVLRHAEERRWPAPIGREAFHGLAGEIVELIYPHSEADEVALLLQCLVAFGSVIGRKVFFRVEADHHYQNLFLVLVGESAKGRKGVSWGQIRRLFEIVDPAWGRNVASGLSSGEGLIYAVRDPVTKIQRVKDRKTGVVTEKEVIEDAGISDKRLQIVESEFASVLSVMRREGNILSAIMRDSWDRGNLRSLTKNSPVRATGAHISIIAHTTTYELLRYLDSTEMANGFANRFLWAMVKRSKFLPEGGRIDKVNFERVIKKLRHAVDFLLPELGEESRLADPVLRWDEAALSEWKHVYPKLSAGGPGMLNAITARGDSQVTRLASVYALLDSSLTIRIEHLRAALAVWKYCEESARYIFGGLLGDPLADALLTALRQLRDDGNTDGMSRTQISEFFGRHRQASEIDRVIRVLAELRFISPIRRDTGGRREERWVALEEPAAK